jgi:catechol-2,3-dioxygenase
MTIQTQNALPTNLDGGKGTPAKEATTKKLFARQETGIGHIGLHAADPAASARFYQDIFGMEIVGGSESDHPLGVSVFLCSRPDEESHEIVFFTDPANAHIAFKVSSLAELRSFHARVVEKNIPVKFVFNHQAAFSFYFEDLNGNMIEVYWPTGNLSSRQPVLEPLDLSQPDEMLLEKISATS